MKDNLVEKKVIVTISMPKDLHERILELAQDRDCPIAQAARHLIKLGFAKMIEDQKPAQRSSKRESIAA